MWLIFFVGTGVASHPGSCHQEPGYRTSAAAFHRMMDVHVQLCMYMHVRKKLVCAYNH